MSKLFSRTGKTIPGVFTNGGLLPVGKENFSLEGNQGFHIINDGEEAISLSVKLVDQKEGDSYPLVVQPLGVPTLHLVEIIYTEIPVGDNLKWVN